MRTILIAMMTTAVAAGAGCKGSSDRAPSTSEQRNAVAANEASAGSGSAAFRQVMDDEAGGTGTAMALEEGRMGKKEGYRADGQYKMKAQVQPSAPSADKDLDLEVAAPGSESATRAWFPETFLFEPRVVTDDAGRATVSVRVPDRLTTWRVLALAHSRGGAQGGTVASFLGTLPVYVDLVVPDRLVRGDDVRLPIQIVNTTERPVTTALTIQVKNATVTGGGGARTVPAQGSLVEYVRLQADRAGTIELQVALRDGDALRRTIEVAPAGRPVVVARSGTLAAPRTLTVTGPANSDPGTDRIRLLAFPGALALLRSELGVCTARSGVADNAYALLLGGKAAAMLTALGDQADPDALRSLAIVTGQRAVRDGRALDVDRATLLTEAALANTGRPVLMRLGQRAASFLAQDQRPDGTFGGGAGWTLQRVLVATAEATRAVASATATPPERQRALNVSIRAAGAFERNAGHVDDGYTAAAILASGAVTGTQAEALREKVRAAIEQADDGARYLKVGDGVVRADGRIPGRAEATALAVLALPSDPTVADLGATLLGSYDPIRGWGDGRANLVTLRAVLQLFKDPVPADVKITLTMDGKPVVEGVLARDKQREVLALEAAAPGLAGAHTWQVTAEPAVPGLGYALTLHGWVPWDPSARAAGLELALPTAVVAVVGKPTDVTLRAVAPAGVELEITQSLPAGVQVDTPSLDALVSAGTITRFVVSSETIELHVPALDPGETFAATYRVIPTLAGTLHSAASSIAAAGTTVHVAPSTWTVR